ncbi:MAG: TlpA family protein disulfide reductase [Actinopolymorphaceae bacterium]
MLAVALAVLGCGPAESNPAGTDVEKPSPTTSAPRDTPTPRDSPSVAEPGRTEVPEQLQFTATTLDGDGFEGASLVGKPAALWFWAPWCPICRNEGPTVTKLSKAYEGKVSIVGVAGLDKLDAMHEFVSETGVGGIPHLADAQGAVWRHFDITTQSTWVLLDADGKIVHAGRLDADELTAHVRRLAS